MSPCKISLQLNSTDLSPLKTEQVTFPLQDIDIYFIHLNENGCTVNETSQHLVLAFAELFLVSMAGGDSDIVLHVCYTPSYGDINLSHEQAPGSG